jgi:hypothetical protein
MSKKDMNHDYQYFAARSGEDTAKILLDKANNWFKGIHANGYLNKLRDLWKAYHGIFDDGVSHEISFTGEQGELTRLNVNHFRNLARNMLVMITSNRPSMEARATNTDVRSIIQTNLANGLLDYYLREKRLTRYIKRATEYAIVLGSGYVKMEWNKMAGKPYDFDEENGFTEYEGDVVFSTLSPFDIIVDPNREDQDHDWVMCRSYKNKPDLAAKYPELAEKIVKLPTKADLQLTSIDFSGYDETDLIPVYEFFHRETESMPEGRYLLFLDEDVVLFDDVNPYRDIPIYRIAASDILGTPHGYSELLDILPIQNAINTLYSTVFTNQSTFGVQNLWVPEGTTLNVDEIADGLNLVQSETKPEPLNLTQTPTEIFNFLSTLERVTETISGINSVARGNPEGSLKSGTALALVQSMALQFMSGLQQSYVELIEDVGTGLISMLRDFADTPRIAAIVGVNNKTEIKKFTGEDLNLVNRVHVDVGNAVSKTLAGRVQMADNLLQYLSSEGKFDAEKYFDVIQSGNIKTMTEDVDSSLNLQRDENERLVSGMPVQALLTDDHSSHLKAHRSVLDDLELRFNPEVLERVTNHIKEHMSILQNTDPQTLAMLGQQALSPPGGSPVSPETAQGATDGAPGAQPIPPEMMENPQEAMMAPDVNIPSPAMPPEIPIPQ